MENGSVYFDRYIFMLFPTLVEEAQVFDGHRGSETAERNHGVEWKFINLLCQTDNLCVQLGEEEKIGGTPIEIFLYLTSEIIEMDASFHNGIRKWHDIKELPDNNLCSKWKIRIKLISNRNDNHFTSRT